MSSSSMISEVQPSEGPCVTSGKNSRATSMHITLQPGIYCHSLSHSFPQVEKPESFSERTGERPQCSAGLNRQTATRWSPETSKIRTKVRKVGRAKISGAT